MKVGYKPEPNSSFKTKRILSSHKHIACTSNMVSNISHLKRQREQRIRKQLRWFRDSHEKKTICHKIGDINFNLGMDHILGVVPPISHCLIRWNLGLFAFVNFSSLTNTLQSYPSVKLLHHCCITRHTAMLNSFEESS